VVRNSRRGARRSLIAGITVLLVGAGAAGYAYAELRQEGYKTITDDAGVRYDIRADWDRDVKPPVVEWNDNGDEALIVTHRPLENPDETDAAGLLADQSPKLCHGDGPAALDIPGAEGAARCDNDGDEPARAIAAIHGGQLWLFELQSSMSSGDRSHITDSIAF